MIRIAIADDRALIREGLRRILDEEPDCRVVFVAEDGHRLLREAQTTPCDVVILDIQMPGPGFLETLSRVRLGPSSPRVLVLSGSPEEQYALRALRGGALGYLQKDVDPAVILEGVRAVAAGRRFVTPRLADVLVKGLTGDPSLAAQDVLSAREFEVLRLLGMGLPTEEVAQRLHISPKTVGTYRARIYQKLDLKGVAQLIHFAVESGITRTDVS